jgi:hypothetical protein
MNVAKGILGKLFLAKTVFGFMGKKICPCSASKRRSFFSNPKPEDMSISNYIFH